MISPAEVLAARGMQRAPEVVELAAKVGIELAIAATMLQRESWGRNVWGHDRVQTAGIYVMGSEVTRDDYLRYKAVRRTIGNQGVGPAQLTSPDLQDRADAAGGCWDWRTNLTVGLQVLSERIRAYGLWGGFKAYNGANIYADGAMQQLAIWREQLAGATEVDDLTPEQDQLLRNVWVQLVGPGPTGGWESWGGGTGEKLTLVDYNRRTNVEVRQSWNTIKAALDEIRAARQEIAQVKTGGVDLDALAAKVADLLAARLQQ